MANGPDSFAMPHAVYSDPILTALTPQGFAFYVRCVSWSSDYENSGWVPTCVLKLMATGLGRWSARADELTNLGLWLPEDDRLGYQIVDWTRHVVRPPMRAAIPAAVREFVYNRDGNACLICGSAANLSLDHVHPWSLGGSDDPDNLQTLCRSCNSRKGAKV